MVRRPTTDPRASSRSRGGRAAPEPEPLGSLLASTHAATARRAGLALDRLTWAKVVGDRIASRTSPGSLKNGVLTVLVESPVWAQELSLLSCDILAKLAERGVNVGSIRFRIGQVGARPELAVRAPPAPPPLPLPSEVEERLAKVEDPALRAVIASAVGHSLANAARARSVPKPKRDARDPQSAGAKSDRPDRSDRPPSAGSRRNRG